MDNCLTNFRSWVSAGASNVIEGKNEFQGARWGNTRCLEGLFNLSLSERGSDRKSLVPRSS